MDTIIDSAGAAAIISFDRYREPESLAIIRRHASSDAEVVVNLNARLKISIEIRLDADTTRMSIMCSNAITLETKEKTWT